MVAREKNGKAFSAAQARWVWMIPLLLLVTLMAGQGINADLIWYDELTSIGHAGGLTGPYSPLEIADSLRQHSPKHTPLFFELLAGWAALVGWHQAALRCLPLFFGLLSLAWIFRLGADFVNVRAGLWACAFLGLNAFWLEYFHEIRMYSLQFMLIMALAWHYLRLSQLPSGLRRFHWIGLTLTAALSLYAQPFSILFHLALGLYHLVFVRVSRVWFRVTLAFAAAAALYLPWLPVTVNGLTAKFDTAFDAMSFEAAVSVFIRLLSNGNWLLLLLLMIAALLPLRVASRRRQLASLWLLALLALAILLLANEAVGLIPLRRSRYFFITWGLWALVIGAGLAHVKPRWIAPLVIAVYLASGFALRAAPDYLSHQGTVAVVSQYPPLADYVEKLRGKTNPQDYVVGFTHVDFVNRRGKSGKSTADYYMETLLGIDGAFVLMSSDAEQLEAAMPAALDDNPYLLFTYNPAQPPANLELTTAYIQRDYQPCDIVLDNDHLLVRRYIYRALTCGRAYQPIHYDNGIKIVDKFAEYSAEADSLHVVTGWEVAERQQLEAYNVSIQILTPAWENVAQAPDRHLYDDVLKWYVVELPAGHLPPGDYRAVVILYDRYSGSAKVTGVDRTTGETGSILPLLHFTIEE